MQQQNTLGNIMNAVKKPVKRSAGRPKANPKALLMRHIGKHFYASELFLSAHRKTQPSLRKTGRGKQPFNNLVKSLQETVSMYHEYFKLLEMTAKESDYDINLTYNITDTDMSKAWSKLKQSYRSDHNAELGQDQEVAEFEKLLTGSRDKYDAHYPFIEWNEFWLKSEIKALERTTHNAIRSFESLGVEVKTLNDVLTSSEAIKGRKTFKNKQHKNEQSPLLVEHSRLVRFNTRLRNLVDSVDESLEDILAGRVTTVEDKQHSVKIKSIINLQEKVRNMTIALNNNVKKSSLPDQYAFKIAMLKKEKLPLTRKSTKQALTEQEQKKVTNLDKEIKQYQSKINALQS